VKAKRLQVSDFKRAGNKKTGGGWLVGRKRGEPYCAERDGAGVLSGFGRGVGGWGAAVNRGERFFETGLGRDLNA